MADAFFDLPADDRREVLGVAASRSGRPVHLLEKDVWVVWALNAMFGSPLGQHLVFKGGTSLSKVYRAVDRFSEDVDLTYDIRVLAPDLVGDADDPLPATRSEEKRWTGEVRRRLPVWVGEEALPIVDAALAHGGLDGRTRAEGERIFIEYAPLATGTGYVAPAVMLEFGARSTGEPSAIHDVACDAADHVANVQFPTARPRTMKAERTFWEKATAVHVFCAQARLRGERFARHWYDLVRLDDARIADAAFADRELAGSVARHKSMFFAEKGADRVPVDYLAAVSGGLHIVPEGAARAVLAEDYHLMVDDGLLLGTAEPFDELMARCTDLEARANQV